METQTLVKCILWRLINAWIINFVIVKMQNTPNPKQGNTLQICYKHLNASICRCFHSDKQSATSCVCLPEGCVCLLVCQVMFPPLLFQFARCRSCDSSLKQRLKLPLVPMPDLNVGDFQSARHHSFIDSSGSASIPSSLIQTLRTAILIALRTVEVFNGLLCGRSIRTCHPAESQCGNLFFQNTTPCMLLQNTS